MPDNMSYQQIAKKITELIDADVFPAGSRLPTEKDLAETFGVKIACIRKARIALEAQGRVKCKGRAGTYVLERKTSLVYGLPKVDALELTEARVLFESEAAALAAPIITDDIIAELESYVAIMSGNKKSHMTADEADEAFHNTIARSTHNHMIIFVIESMWKMRTKSAELQKVYHKVCHDDSSHREDEHFMILQALKNRDPSAARRAMRAHFSRILEALIDSSEKEALQVIKQQTSANRSRFLLCSQLSQA